MNSGAHTLSSGVVLRWLRSEIGESGLLSGDFDSPPSDADLNEASEFMKTLMPEDATLSFERHGLRSDIAATGMVLRHVTGGSERDN